MVALWALISAVWPQTVFAEGASLLFSPATGSFSVGSTFNVSIVVNTGGKSVNAVKADIKFPANKLQVVNPSAGTSFISIWVSQPTYSNTAGTLSFQGGLPNPGIKTDSGVISTITFRATAPGTAKLTLLDTSQVLANDGQGTNLLSSRGDATFTLNLAAPEGPIISSSSHPDQNTWYQNRTVNFEWDEITGATGYSYSFDQNPRTTPPERADATTDRNASVTADKDGRWYFHVRAKVTSWGGTSHYAVLIDGTPPAAFTPTLDPTSPKPSTRPELKFITTDAMSGMEHFEMQLIALDDSSQGTPFFTEQVSPVRLPELKAGRYQVIVRAYDQAGNSTDGKLEFSVVEPPSGSIIGRVPLLQNTLFTNLALIGAGVLVLILAIWLIIRWRRRAKDVIHDIQKLEKETLAKESELVRTIQAARSLESSIEQQLEHESEASQIASQAVQPQPSQQIQPPPNPETAQPEQSTDFLHPPDSQPPS
jgi:hypothetical protein